MKRPPLWTWALPACVALGVLLGVRLRGAPAAVPEARNAGADNVSAPGLAVGPKRDTATVVDAVPAESVSAGADGLVTDSVEWGWVGGEYGPLSSASAVGSISPPPADTLPEPPIEAVQAGQGGSPESASVPRSPARPTAPVRPSGAGPVQGLSLGDAIRRPLVGSVRADGRLSFYAAWHAPPSRASLVGEWASPGQCGGTVRLDYEQPAPGLGAVRGVGSSERAPPWSIALLVPRQHCTAATGKWVAPRPPRGDEVAMLSELASGERPSAVVIHGEEAWIAWPERAVRARIRAGRPVEVWSATAEEGSSIRLLGVWEGEGVWVATGAGGRVLKLWRMRT